MDQLPDALEAASGPRPDDLDLPALHHRARTRHLRRRATALTAVLGVVAMTGIGVAAATGGGGSPAQLTASEGAPEATSTTGAIPATVPCVGFDTVPMSETTSTTTAGPSTTTTTTVVPDIDGGSGASEPDIAVGDAGPATGHGASGAAEAEGVPETSAMTEEQLRAVIEYQESRSFETTTTTAVPAPSDADVATDPTDAGEPVEAFEPVEPVEPGTQTTVLCASEEGTTTTAPTTTTANETTTIVNQTSTTSDRGDNSIPVAPTPSRIVFAGTLAGEGPIVDPDSQGCPQMHHHLDAAVTLNDGSRWQLSERYRGVHENWVWSGEGTFGFTDKAGNSFGGTFTSRVEMPTTGEPYRMTITRGAGRFAGATGTCDVDNHVEDTVPGRNRQYGGFTCDIGLGAGAGN